MRCACCRQWLAHVCVQPCAIARNMFVFAAIQIIRIHGCGNIVNLSAHAFCRHLVSSASRARPHVSGCVRFCVSELWIVYETMPPLHTHIPFLLAMMNTRSRFGQCPSGFKQMCLLVFSHVQGMGMGFGSSLAHRFCTGLTRVFGNGHCRNDVPPVRV